MNNKISNSTYGIRIDQSFKAELFATVSLHWRSSIIPVLKIRKAKWKPRNDRSNQAVFYFDVDSPEKFSEILSAFEKFDFRGVEEFFDEMFTKKKCMNTGETQDWLTEKFLPAARQKFTAPYNGD